MLCLIIIFPQCVESVNMDQNCQFKGEKGKPLTLQHSEQEKGRSRKLQASQPHLSPWEVMEHVILGTISRYMKDKKAIGSGPQKFTNWK